MNIINSESMPKSNGHYSQCIEHAGILYISGQLPINPTSKVIAENIKGQTTQALSKIEQILIAAGSRKQDILQLRVYIVGIEHWDSVNEICSAFFEDHRPVRCIVPVPELHFGCLIEIEAISTIAN